MKNIIYIFLIAILFFASCTSTRQITNIVKPTFENSKFPVVNWHDNITFELYNIEASGEIIETERLSSLIIPAIVYWQWGQTTRVTINPKAVGNVFRTNFLLYAESLGLSELLDSRQLKVKIETMPSTFIHSNSGLFYFLFFVFGWGSSEYILFEEKDFFVRYEIHEEGREKITGEIQAVNQTAPQVVNRGSLNFTRNNVAQFKVNIGSAARETVEMLMFKMNNLGG
jgi:hypothetical protein